LWLQRKVSGSLATSLLEQNDAVLLVTRIADALAKIHGSGVETDRRHTLADEIATLRQRIARVIARHPRHQTRLERILARSVDLAAVMPQSRPAGIHRDFYADQIISNGDRLYLLDFDLYASGDPALDAGNFLGHLTEQSLRKWGHPDALSECSHSCDTSFSVPSFENGFTTPMCSSTYVNDASSWPWGHAGAHGTCQSRCCRIREHIRRRRCRCLSGMTGAQCR
jgi:hypothetical protein